MNVPMSSVELTEKGIGSSDQIKRMKAVEKAIGLLESMGHEIPDLHFQGAVVFRPPFQSILLTGDSFFDLSSSIDEEMKSSGARASFYINTSLDYFIYDSPLWAVEAIVARTENIVGTFIMGGQTSRTDMQLIIAEFNLRQSIGEPGPSIVAYNFATIEWYPGKSSDVPPMWAMHPGSWLKGHQHKALSEVVRVMM